MRIDLKQELTRRFGESFDATAHQLTGGYEAEVWRVDDIVVRVSPTWRTDAELLWVHELTQHCATALPQVIAPLHALNGETLFRWNDHPITLYPFVDGEILDRDDDHQIQQAARLLAQIHTLGLTWQDKRPRPSLSNIAPSIPTDQIDPTSIVDPDLDEWITTVFEASEQVQGAIHGDYYRANILCEAGQIAGIIDWDESEIRPLITEVAWAMWEFTHAATGDDLDVERANLFLNSYCTERDSLTDTDIAFVIPLIRRHLRYEIRRSIADEQRGDSVDLDYRNAEIRAFNNLRHCVFP